MRVWGRSLLVVASLAVSLTSARAQDIAIFDAHMHYNQEPNPTYPLDKLLDVFKRNNVTGVLATSRPNKGTHQLMDAKTRDLPNGLWVVPFIRPYRIRGELRADRGRV
jgi:hypothetical protein